MCQKFEPHGNFSALLEVVIFLTSAHMRNFPESFKRWDPSSRDSRKIFKLLNAKYLISKKVIFGF